MDADTTKAIQDAVKNAVSDAIKDTIRDAAKPAIALAAPDALKEAVKEEEKKKFDPFRNTILFLVGLLAFCLSIIVGIFGTMSDYATWREHALVAWLIGSVLAWISLAALVATIGMLILQVWKAIYFHKAIRGEPGSRIKHGLQALLMTIAVLCGAAAVNYCVRAGAVMRNADLVEKGKMPSFMTALCSLVSTVQATPAKKE